MTEETDSTPPNDNQPRIQYRKLNNVVTTRQFITVIAIGAIIVVSVVLFQVFFNNNSLISNGGSEEDNAAPTENAQSEEEDGDEGMSNGNDESPVGEDSENDVEVSGSFIIETMPGGDSPDVVYNGGGPEALPITNVREGVLHYHNAGSSSCPPVVERVEEESLDSYLLHIATYPNVACTMDYMPVHQAITHDDSSREFAEDSDIRVSIPSLEADDLSETLPTPDVEAPDTETGIENE